MSPDDQPSISLKPLRRTPLYAGVAERLREFITAENLQPGERLPAERVLAQQLGVSRTSVRQGLTALRVMGLVDVQHGAGAYLLRPVDDVVPPIAVAAVTGNPGIRAAGQAGTAIEAEAARLAALGRTDADLARMRAATERMATDVRAGGNGVEADREFHAAVVRAAGNEIFLSVLESIAGELGAIAAASLARAGQPPRSLATHRLILEAIEARNGAVAARLMRDHLLISGELEPAADD